MTAYLINHHYHYLRVFLVVKPNSGLHDKVVSSVQYLINRGFHVVVEADVYAAIFMQIKETTTAASLSSNGDHFTIPSQPIVLPLSIYTDGSDQASSSSVDFIITFGGDGLLLHVNTLYAGRSVPPIMSFDFGSLGFLCPFAYDNFAAEVSVLVCAVVIEVCYLYGW